jgi:hypothetical protein
MTNYLMYTLLIGSALADSFINLWIDGDCAGPPSAYFQLEPSATRIYPAAAKYFVSKMPVDTCGTGVTTYISPKQCCVTSLEPDHSLFVSAAHFTADGNNDNYLPKAAIGRIYCRIVPTSPGISGFKLLGFWKARTQPKSAASLVALSESIRSATTWTPPKPNVTNCHLL